MIQFKNSALMLAAEFGKFEAVEALLSYSDLVDKDLKNEYGYTALILAAENGHANCVEALIRSGATQDLDNMFGKTALIMGAENGHMETVRRLLTSFDDRQCADVNKASKRGMSALMLAAVKGHVEVVELLTANGGNIHTINKDNVSLC
jgi:uncharacterized protein